MVGASLAPATINQKLAAIKSLVTYANQIGKCHYTLSQIKFEKLTTYRDPKGIPSEQFKLMLDAVNTETIKGLRALAILLLLWGNALLCEVLKIMYQVHASIEK